LFGTRIFLADYEVLFQCDQILKKSRFKSGRAVKTVKIED